MDAKTLRLAAIAAVGGGVLRIVATLLPALHLPDATLQQCYFATDFLLLLGAFGIYAADAGKRG